MRCCMSPPLPPNLAALQLSLNGPALKKSHRFDRHSRVKTPNRSLDHTSRNCQTRAR